MPKPPTTARVWVCKIAPKTTVRCEDLPLEVYASIFEQTGIHWFELMNAPLRYEKAGRLLYEACCSHAGVEAKSLTLRDFADLYELAEDDKPSMFEDGIPDPNADAPATT